MRCGGTIGGKKRNGQETGNTNQRTGKAAKEEKGEDEQNMVQRTRRILAMFRNLWRHSEMQSSQNKQTNSEKRMISVLATLFLTLCLPRAQILNLRWLAMHSKVRAITGGHGSQYVRNFAPIGIMGGRPSVRYQSRSTHTVVTTPNCSITLLSV